MNKLKNIFQWLDGGFNLPSESAITSAPLIKNDQEAPTGVLASAWAFLTGGYNLPSHEQVERAPATWSPKVSYPTGIRGWFAGSFNVPKFVPNRR